ncbi:MAG: Fe-S-containing hydro-lyase [Armatimonadota bacterium]
MKEPIRLTTPISEEDVRNLRAGDQVLLSGVIYTGRDAAHKRLIELLQAGKELPFDINGQIIYYVGPSPAKPGEVIGSAGPTTSGRMDVYAPALIELGLKGMIGKGLRNQTVIDAMKKHGAVYFGATGGAAALLAKRIKACEVVAYEDLGTEAVCRLMVEDFPVVVVNDTHGGDLYKEGVKSYERVSGEA